MIRCLNIPLAGVSNLVKRRRPDGGFTLIEVVIASLLGAMVITGAFVILIIFRQQTRMAWAERAMDQYMFLAARYLTEQFTSVVGYQDRGVIQNNYAVWDFYHGDVAKPQNPLTKTEVSGNRTEGLLINDSPFDPNFPPRYAGGRHGVPMWDSRDNFELLYLGIEHPSGSGGLSVEKKQVVITMRMRYRHRERSALGFLFGGDYARTRTFQTRSFLRNMAVPSAEAVTAGGTGPSAARASSGSLGWTLASGKSAQEYLTEKWKEKQSQLRPTRVP
ncbi:MAG: prepilin-type N-terminal cleavage/methylation domain-containing protein [bacterium]